LFQIPHTVTAIEPSYRFCEGSADRRVAGLHTTRSLALDSISYTSRSQIFANWESRNREDPFGAVAVAASYLFEELYLQGVLTSEFFSEQKEISARTGSSRSLIVATTHWASKALHD
jgi:hypothetical protein